MNSIISLNNFPKLLKATLYKINVHTLQKVWTFLEIRVWTFSFPRILIVDIFELFPGLKSCDLEIRPDLLNEKTLSTKLKPVHMCDTHYIDK